MPNVFWMVPADCMRLPSITPKWSSLNLAQRTFILPLHCFQLPAKISQFKSLSFRGFGGGRAPCPDKLTQGSVPVHSEPLRWRFCRGNLSSAIRLRVVKIGPGVFRSRYLFVHRDTSKARNSAGHIPPTSSADPAGRKKWCGNSAPQEEDYIKAWVHPCRGRRFGVCSKRLAGRVDEFTHTAGIPEIPW
jgi:hypothetical protein